MATEDLVLASLKRYQMQRNNPDEVLIESDYGEALELIYRMKSEKAAIDSNSRKLEQKIKTAYAKFAKCLENATKDYVLPRMAVNIISAINQRSAPALPRIICRK